MFSYITRGVVPSIINTILIIVPLIHQSLALAAHNFPMVVFTADSTCSHRLKFYVYARRTTACIIIYLVAIIEMMHLPLNGVLNAHSIKTNSMLTRRAMTSNRRLPSLSTFKKYKESSSSCCFAPYTKWYHVIKPSSNNQRYSISYYSSSSFLSMTSLMSTNNNWEQITNHRTSKTVKLFKSVHKSKSKRSEMGLTVAEGVRLVTDILSNEHSRQLVRRIVISETLLYDETSDEYQQKLLHWIGIVDEESRQRKAKNAEEDDVPTCSINIGTDEVLKSCSGTVTSQGIVALMDIPPQYNPDNNSQDIDAEDNMPPFYLILDGLSDPGNVGTLLRSCAASFVTALILLPGSCDVWNPKAVRSAMGASFRVPVLEINNAEKHQLLDEVLEMLKNWGVDKERVFAATMEASGDDANPSIAHYDIDFTTNAAGAAVILGKEGEGLRSDVLNAINQGKISTVHVPMSPGVESLNAGVCGSVIMFERMRQLST